MEKEYLLKKWLNGTLSEEETSAFQELDDYTLFKTIVEDAAHFKASSFSSATDYKLLQQKLPKKKTNRSIVRQIPWYAKIASVLVIGISVYFMFFLNAATTIETAVGEKITIVLPDASTVNLNAASEISYVKKEWDNKRLIKLFGEAFFDVANGSVFEVVTSEGTITVLGTEFNVKQRETTLEVACFEGKVRVDVGGVSEILEVGDQLFLRKGKIRLLRTQEELPSWTKNVSSFEREPFEEVLKELERHFKIQVKYEIKGQKETLFTGGFEHDNL
ncbi:FecR family protein, partial [uncultured Muriicola sp.]|uniref:FecR family protein n=1 Tax=uncultured Muriicola sp. TaxID=1583102 RepID=UPI002624EA21